MVDFQLNFPLFPDPNIAIIQVGVRFLEQECENKLARFLHLEDTFRLLRRPIPTPLVHLKYFGNQKLEFRFPALANEVFDVNTTAL